MSFDGYNNVKHFAATPGATPTTAEIQTCIDQSAAQGKSVYFPPGTYDITTGLLLPSKTVIVGRGRLSVLRAIDACGVMLRNADFTAGNDDIRIEDITLDHNKDARTGYPAGAGIVRFQAATGNACDNLRIRGVEAFATAGAGSTLFISGARRCTIEECHFYKGRKDGITIASGEDIVIQRNIVRDHIDDLVTAWSGARRVSIIDNFCDHTDPPNDSVGQQNAAGGAIALRSAREVEIVGNFCRGGVQGGVVVISGTDVEVVGNLILESGNTSHPNPLGYGTGKGTGVLILCNTAVTSERINVSANVISVPRGHGVNVSNTNSGGTMRDIAISSNQIGFDQQSTSYEGSGVVCLNPSGAVTDLRISGNDIRNARGVGVKVTKSSGGPAPKRIDLQDNRVVDSGLSGSGNQRSGILLDGVSGFLVLNNRAQDTRAGKTQTYGLEVLNQTGKNLVTGNDFSDNINSPRSTPSATTGSTHIEKNLGVDLN